MFPVYIGKLDDDVTKSNCTDLYRTEKRGVFTLQLSKKSDERET